MMRHVRGPRSGRRCAALALCLLHLSACTRTEPVVLPPPGPSVYALEDLTIWTHSGRRIAATEVLGDRDSLWGVATWPGQASVPFSIRVDSIARLSRTQVRTGRTIAVVGGLIAIVVLVRGVSMGVAAVVVANGAQ
jgi:hypothetical protein